MMKHYEVVAAVIEHDGKILCMQRNKGKFDYVSYKFEFPGGKVEAGEERHTALERELREEMDMDISIPEDAYLMTVEHTYPDFAITMQFIKKSDAEDSEFYFMGEMLHKQSIGTTITGNKGEKLSIVQMFYEMKTPVEAKIYDYFEG